MTQGETRAVADINATIGGVLRYGVIISAALILVGLVGILARPAATFPSNVGELVSSNYGRPTLQPDVLVSGVLAGNPLFVLELGVLVLLATPIVRVATSVILFAAERDSTYVAVTLIVLGILILSILVVGPAIAAAG